MNRTISIVAFVGLAVLAIVVLRAAYHQANINQFTVFCYSGGHLIFETSCEHCDMLMGGYVQGVDMGGHKFAVSGDCAMSLEGAEGPTR